MDTNLLSVVLLGLAIILLRLGNRGFYRVFALFQELKQETARFWRAAPNLGLRNHTQVNAPKEYRVRYLVATYLNDIYGLGNSA